MVATSQGPTVYDEERNCLDDLDPVSCHDFSDVTAKCAERQAFAGYHRSRKKNLNNCNELIFNEFLQFIPSSIVERNSTGHVIGFSGDLFQRFDLLSKRLQFT